MVFGVLLLISDIFISKNNHNSLFYCGANILIFFIKCRQVPYTALTMYLTPDQAERDSATGFRMIFELVGVLLAATIQGFGVFLCSFYVHIE